MIKPPRLSPPPAVQCEAKEFSRLSRPARTCRRRSPPAHLIDAGTTRISRAKPDAVRAPVAKKAKKARGRPAVFRNVNESPTTSWSRRSGLSRPLGGEWLLLKDNQDRRQHAARGPPPSGTRSIATSTRLRHEVSQSARSSRVVELSARGTRHRRRKAHRRKKTRKIAKIHKKFAPRRLRPGRLDRHGARVACSTPSTR